MIAPSAHWRRPDSAMPPPSHWYRDFMAAAGVDVSSPKPLKAEPGPPMTLDNMRANDVRRLVVYCLAPYCQHSAVIDADAYDGSLLVKSFDAQMLCTRCGLIGADVRPNWRDKAIKSPLGRS
jgi:hypothetical protein